MSSQLDAIVIGAGASGLIAAWEIAVTGRRVAVLEAGDGAGGRIRTMQPEGFSVPVELGAEFIHGDLTLTLALLEAAGIKYHPLKGEIWRKDSDGFHEQNGFIEDYPELEKKFSELHNDISVAEFLEKYLAGEQHSELRFTLKNYVEGYYAADTRRASTFTLRDELAKAGDLQYRVEGGYGRLVDYLFAACEDSGVEFFFNEPVQQISWRRNSVEIQTAHTGIQSKKVLITVSLGTLQCRRISFSPALPEKMNAADQCGFGPVVKVILEFDYPFWQHGDFTNGKDLSELSFLFSTEEIPTWWTQFPANIPIITGWVGGPGADKFMEYSDDQIVNTALDSLASVFETTRETLSKMLKASAVHNWIRDPFICGAYSYEVVDGSIYREIIAAPVEQTIFFAGEGLFRGPEIGTVEAALVNGRDTAHALITTFGSR